MQTKVNLLQTSRRDSFMRPISALWLLMTALFCHSLMGGDITWVGGTSGTGSTWLGLTNWSSGTVPASSDNAIFSSGGTATLITIQMLTAGGLQRVGAITLDANNFASRAIRNNSTSSGGVLELNGAGGMLLANYSSATLILSNSYSTSLAMAVRLASSGTIHVANAASAGQIVIQSSISEANGSQGFTKTGSGILYLRGTNNTFTGSITNTGDGWLKVDDVGTFGAGAAPVYLTGNYGGIISGADRGSGVPLASPIVVSADAYIKSDGGTAGTLRTIPFIGPFSGSSGSLTIANLTPSVGNTFVVRLLGAFSFGLPLSVGSIADTSGSFSVLQCYNSATNGSGTQTFSGVVSGPGSVWRQGATSSAGGTTIFTGNNTYSGGTLITYGTLLVNNTAGTGTGSGSVTVTNQGVLGGYGSAGSTLVGLGGTISPGTSVSNLSVSDITLGEGGNYVWQISSATGTAGTAWDLITVGGGSGTWTDLASSGNPFTIKLDSMGVAPTGWNSGVARDWVIVHGGTASGFDVSHFAIDTIGFAGTVQGVFSLSVVGGDLHLAYTPAADIVINVPSGTQSQAQAGYPQLTGTFGVMKIGIGEVVLNNAANNYAGSTKLYAGTASLAVDALNGSGALGAASTSVLLGNTTGNSNATLNINTAGVTMGRNLTVQSGSSGAKTISTTISSGVANFSGDVVLQDNLVLTAPTGGEASISGQITGNGNVTKTGGGAVTLSALNTYSGSTTLSNGTLNLNNRAGSGTFTIAGASTIDNTSSATVTLVNTAMVWNADFTFTGTSNLNLGTAAVTLGGNRSITVSSNTLTVGGTISGSAGITKLGGGTMVLNGLNSYSGNTTVSEGAIQVNATATFGDGTGTMNWAGGTIISANTRNISTGILPNPISMTAGTIIQNTASATAGSRYFPFGSSAITTTAGTLTIRNIATGNYTNIMRLRLHGAGFTFSRPIVFDNSLAGSQVNNTCQLDCASSNGTPAQIFTGVISGPGRVDRTSLTAGDAGTTILAGANTHTLGTELNRGSLGLGAPSVSSGGIIISAPAGTGMLEWTGDSALFAYGGARVLENYVYLNGVRDAQLTGTNDLTLSGTMNVGSVDKAFTVDNTAVTTFSGQLTNIANLIKGGAGVLVLTGDNQNSGLWTVTNGTLLVNNSTGSGTGTSNVVVSGSGKIGGTGTIAGSVSGGGSVTPGASAGTLTVGGGLDLSGGGTYVWELAANSTNGAGSNFDVLALTGGNGVLGGISKLSINFIGSATAPDSANPFWQSARSWTILTVGGSATNSGLTAFASILNGTYSAGSFTNYADVSGNIILAYTPAGTPPPPRPLISSTIAGAGTANSVLSWGAVNGVTYTVQCKTNLNQAGWITLGTATAVGTTATYTDTTGPHNERYYRIIWP